MNNTLDILAIGGLTRDETGKILWASSTSTLIKADGRLIVVDTGGKDMRSALKMSLRQIGVFAKDVDTVVLTHNHSDHKGNVDMFQNAKLYVHSGGDDVPKGAEIIEGDVSIAPGVELVYTPGHTWDSMSVFVDGIDRKYAITGDAVPLQDNIIKGVPPGICVCKDVAMKSIKTICDYADVIIPGHGAPFKI